MSTPHVPATPIDDIASARYTAQLDHARPFAGDGHNGKLKRLRSCIQEDVYTAGFIILMLGTLTVIGTLVSDILLAVVDPRIKLTNR